jgi:hypothetical protein
MPHHGCLSTKATDIVSEVLRHLDTSSEKLLNYPPAASNRVLYAIICDAVAAFFQPKVLELYFNESWTETRSRFKATTNKLLREIPNLYQPVDSINGKCATLYGFTALPSRLLYPAVACVASQQTR